MENMNMEILLLDDEEDSLEFSRRTIAGIVNEKQIHTAQTVDQALEILRTYPIELAFLDIELTQNDGFSLCDYINRNYPGTAVAFLTGHVDMGAKSYEYEAIDFLVKPIDTLRLERTFRRFRERRKETEKTGGIMIESGAQIIQLEVSEILYIAKKGNSCIIKCADGHAVKTNSSLDKMETLLEGYDFFRSHQSFLIPLHCISHVGPSDFGSGYDAVLKNGETVPVSRYKYTLLRECLMKRNMHL